MLQIYSDGGSRGNPGKAACAYVIYKDNELVKQSSKYLGLTTNNVAEYNGVILALQWLVKNKMSFDFAGFDKLTTSQDGKIKFCSDSELVVKQLTGVYKIRDMNLLQLSNIIKDIIKNNNLKITFQHIPRAENKLADKLVNEELDRQA